MLTQKQINVWLPEAIATFQSKMPPISVPYPEIHILSRKTWQKKRIEVVERLQSPSKNTGNTSIMETLHGDNGDAILIYQMYLKYNPYNPNQTKKSFMHLLWHELGHFYSLYEECPGANLYTNMDQKSRSGDDAIIQIGYWLWTEFIAESIACHIDADEDINWDIYDWHPIRNRLYALLQAAFYGEPYSIDQYALAFYMATILSDKKTLAFFDAVNNGKIKRCGRLTPGLNKTVILTAADIDPYARSAIDDYYLPDLDVLCRLLTQQIAKNHFWEISVEFVKTLGIVLCNLRMTKISHLPEDELNDVMRQLQQFANN